VNLLPEKCPKCEAEISVAGPKASCASCGYVFSEMELKMSKSRGNFYPIREVISAFEPEALRMFLLSSHYRSPIAFSHKILGETEKRLDRVYETLDGIGRFTADQTTIPGESFSKVFGFDPQAAFAEAMDDDFNAALAVADLGKVFAIANDLIHGTEKERLGRALAPAERSRLLTEIREIALELGGHVGLFQEAPSQYLSRRKQARPLAVPPEEIERLIEERTLARKNKDWKRSDEIRDALKAKGIVLKDGKSGTTWEAES
jgi:cysteinyl-tRNA synthetase